MRVVLNNDKKIEKKYEKGTPLDILAAKSKAGKKIVGFIKAKQKMGMARKLLDENRITPYEYTSYVKKVLKEKELMLRNVENCEEILFEGEDSNIVSIFNGRTIEYYIDQRGFRNRCDDLNDAITKFVMLSI